MRFVCIQKWWDFSSQLTIATHLFFAGKFFSFPYGILFSTLSLTLSHLILDALEISEQEISWEKRPFPLLFLSQSRMTFCVLVCEIGKTNRNWKYCS